MVGGKSLKIPNAEDGLAIVIFVNLIIVTCQIIRVLAIIKMFYMINHWYSRISLKCFLNYSRMLIYLEFSTFDISPFLFPFFVFFPVFLDISSCSMINILVIFRTKTEQKRRELNRTKTERFPISSRLYRQYGRQCS